MLRALFGFIAFIAGVVLSFAAPVYFVKFLVDVFHYDVGFWYAVTYNVIVCIIVEIVAYFVCVIAAMLAATLK